MKKVKKTVAKKATMKKAQMGISQKPTADSTKYFNEQANFRMKRLSQIQDEYSKKYPGESVGSDTEYKTVSKGLLKNLEDRNRQANKGKPGYDANGYPLKKQKMGGVTKKTAVKKAVAKKVVKPVAKKVVKSIKKKK